MTESMNIIGLLCVVLVMTYLFFSLKSPKTKKKKGRKRK